MEDKTTNIDDSQEQSLEKMECDDVPTKRELIAELTENVDSLEKATGTEGKPGPSTMASKTTCTEKESTSVSVAPCEKDSNVIEENERASDPTKPSSPVRKLLRKIKERISPSRDSKSEKETGTKPKKGRTESVPPSDKSQLSKDNINPGKACKSEVEDHFKTGSQQTSVMSFIKKRIFKTGGEHSDQSDTAAIVSDEETFETEETPLDVTKSKMIQTEIYKDLDQSKRRWGSSESCSSEKSSYDGTTLSTDIASTCSGAGADVFSSDKPPVPSEAVEIASEKDAADNPASSPKKKLSDI